MKPPAAAKNTSSTPQATGSRYARPTALVAWASRIAAANRFGREAAPIMVRIEPNLGTTQPCRICGELGKVRFVDAAHSRMILTCQSCERDWEETEDMLKRRGPIELEANIDLGDPRGGGVVPLWRPASAVDRGVR